MGCEESISSLFKKESDELLNKYYNIPYDQRKANYKKYVRREFELFYEYINKAESNKSEMDYIFSYHQSAEKQIYKYSNETGCIIS